MKLLVKMRDWPTWLLALVATAPVLVLTPFSRALLAINPLLFPFLTLLCGAWGIVVAAQWWVTLDEASREAHKFAWFWGGSIGLAIVVLSITGIETVRPVAELVNRATHAIPGWRPGPAGYVAGVLTCGIGQVLGYVVAWAGWWMVRKNAR